MKTKNENERSQPARIDLGFAKECDRKNRNPIRRALHNWRTFTPWCFRVGAFAIVVLVVLLFIDIDLRLRELTRPISTKSGKVVSRSPEWYLSRILSKLSSIDTDISSIKFDVSSIDSDITSLKLDIGEIDRYVNKMWSNLYNIESGLSTIEVRVNR